MWCTAGLIHASGHGVSAQGEILPYAPETSVFRFVGASITCDDDGVTRWTAQPDARDRFVFEVTDLENYQPAMIRALGQLLTSLTSH